MINIKETVKTPSQALQYMVDGLRKQRQRKDFRIDMSTFGEKCESEKICYGCAATCAVQEMSNKDFSTSNIYSGDARAKAIGAQYRELRAFEDAIDSARVGSLFYLFDFFDMLDNFNYDYNCRFDLKDDNWIDELIYVETLITELKELGL